MNASRDRGSPGAGRPRPGLRVMKFGGSSVGSGAMFRRVADIVKDTPGGRAVVISAMQGVTNRILEALDKVRTSEAEIRPFLADLRDRHERAILEAGATGPHAEEAWREVERLLQRLERLLYGIAYTEEATDKTKDLALSFGERLSIRILAGVLNTAGVEAKACDADKIGMLTDGVFGNASPLLPLIEKRFADEVAPFIARGGVPVITGFFGCDIDGHVTTFGRGGSDYSAAIVANALNAEVLEVWKDVAGFLTTDPRICDDAVPIERMSYDEAAELAYLGAQVLHPRTVEPVKLKDIPIRVRNTTRPDAPGTLIMRLDDVTDRELRSIGARDGLGILKVYGAGMAYTPGIGEKCFRALAQARVNVYNMAASQASFAMLVNEEDLDRGRQALEEIIDGIMQGVETIPRMSLLCVVGKGIGAMHGTAGRIFTAVGDAGVNIEMISVGASDIALNFVVRSKDKEKAIHALHDAFLVPSARNERSPAATAGSSWRDST